MELKLCPFCGRKAKVEPVGFFGPVNDPNPMDFWWVACKCDANGPVRKSKGWAIKSWNKRV